MEAPSAMAPAVCGGQDITTYARRRARMIFLREHLDEDHPVITTERSLIDMARSRLVEGLLASLGSDGLARERPSLEARIREAMRASMPSLVEDPDQIAVLVEKADAEPMDSLFGEGA